MRPCNTGPKRGSTPGANMLPKARNFRSHRGYILVRDIGRRRKAEADGEAEQGRRPAGELRSARRGGRQAPVRRPESQTARPPASRPVRAGDPGAGTGVRSGVRTRARHALPAQTRGGGVRRGPFCRHGRAGRTPEPGDRVPGGRHVLPGRRGRLVGRHRRVLLHRPPLARGGAARPRELRRVLRPGGLLLLSFHVGDEIRHLDELWGQEVSLDFYFFRAEDMEGLLGEAGFEVEEVIERPPYGEDAEAQTQRAYVFARNPV